MAHHVLVVDDEPGIRRVLRAYLEADGFAVTEAGSATEALAVMGVGDGSGGAAGPVAAAPVAAAPAGPAADGASDRPDPVDLVLLDVGLPDIDGLEVLRRLRAGSQLPVILVTARSEEIDTLVGLAVGADDYIAKPFSPREVVARSKTVLRRASTGWGVPGGPPGAAAGATAGSTAGPDATVDATGAAGPAGAPVRAPADGPHEVLEFDGLTIDLDGREVWLADRPVSLSALEFDLLAALAASPGRVFSRAQLLERVWGYDVFNGERVVDVHIRSLRQALGDDASSPRLIGTVRGVGYKFLPGFRRA